MAEGQSTAVVEGVEPVEYRTVPDHPGYRVGSDGSVWTCLVRKGLPSGGTTFVVSDQWTRMRPSPDRDGYLRVTLATGRKGERKQWRLHQLILTVFVGPKPPGLEACHYPDRDRTNNRVSNLRWDTRTANAADAASHGTATTTGEKNGHAKLTAEQVSAIRREHQEGGWTYVELGRKYGVHESTIRLVVRREVWAAVP